MVTHPTTELSVLHEIAQALGIVHRERKTERPHMQLPRLQLAEPSMKVYRFRLLYYLQLRVHFPLVALAGFDN